MPYDPVAPDAFACLQHNLEKFDFLWEKVKGLEKELASVRSLGRNHEHNSNGQVVKPIWLD